MCALWLGFNSKVVLNNPNIHQVTMWRCSFPTTGHPYGQPISPICSTIDPSRNWVGVSCDAAACAINSIQLPSNGLSGTISPLITTLTSMKILSLSANSLHGSIPSYIGNLNLLQGVYLFSNSLSQAIPSSIDGLVNVIDFNLYANRLSGTLPQTICQMKSVVNWDVSSNNLVGAVPDTFCCLTGLAFLDLHRNHLTCYPRCITLAPGSSTTAPPGLNHVAGEVVPSDCSTCTTRLYYTTALGWLTQLGKSNKYLDTAGTCSGKLTDIEVFYR